MIVNNGSELVSEGENNYSIIIRWDQNLFAGYVEFMTFVDDVRWKPELILTNLGSDLMMAYGDIVAAPGSTIAIKVRVAGTDDPPEDFCSFPIG